MADHISPALREQVRLRAGKRCEYCLTPEWILLAGCEVDHVISRKHQGQTDLSNLAFSCARCNRAKGTDIGSIDHPTNRFVRFYNPRVDDWEDHFRIDGTQILGLTEIGVVTVRILRLNDANRCLERSLLQRLGEFPHASE